MDLKKAKIIADSLLELHGLKEKKWVFKFDSAKNRIGLTQSSKKVISISKQYVEILDELETIDTILHEIAHALVGCKHMHDDVWKKKAIDIGCNGQPTYCGTIRIKKKYKGVCGNCNNTIFAHRRNNLCCYTCSDGKFRYEWSLNE